MKTLSSVFALLLSLGAIALSGVTFLKVSVIEKQLSDQAALSPAEEAPTVMATDDSDALTSSSETAADSVTAVDGESANIAFEPGQFSALGYKNAVQIELVSAQRLSEAESGEEGIVNVNVRLKRTVDAEEIRGDGYYSFTFYEVKGRNPETNAVYNTQNQRYTDTTHIRELSSEAWSEGYFWLKDVPEGVQTLDIVFPETATFEGVRISG